MARKQTRRSVSMSRAVYERVKAHAERLEVSMSSVVEQALADLPDPPAPVAK